MSIVLKVNEPTVAVRFRFVTLDGNWATINNCSTGFAEKSRFGDIVMSSRPFCTDAFALKPIFLTPYWMARIYLTLNGNEFALVIVD